MKYDCLIVDDEKELAMSTSEYFNLFNIKTASVYSKNDAIDFLKENQCSLILLDINLGDGSGFELCKYIREESNIPILFISARNTDDDKIIALNIGGDDYIEKPYDIDILLAKIKGIFRRKYEVEEMREGNLILNSAKQTLQVDGKDVPMTGKEFELLKLLIENKGTTMKKEYLFNTIWGSDSESEPQTLNVHINSLRKKIEANPKKPEHIVTVWGVGYRYE